MDLFTMFFGKPSFGPNNMDSRDANFNEMFQEIDEMMKAFNLADFNMNNYPGLEGPKHEDQNHDRNLRDHFLKPHNQEPRENFPQRVPSTSLFEKLFEFEPDFNRTLPTENFNYEEDLDKKIMREGLDKVVREDLFKPEEKKLKKQHTGQSNFYGHSTSIRRIQRSDGSIEEIKSQKSSDGNEEKTVTRIMGDQSHTLIEKKSNDGTVLETEEFLDNIDHDKIEEFDNMWKKWKNPMPRRIEDNHSNNNPTNSDSDQKNNEFTYSLKTPTENGSLLYKLFSWLK